VGQEATQFAVLTIYIVKEIKRRDVRGICSSKLRQEMQRNLAKIVLEMLEITLLCLCLGTEIILKKCIFFRLY